jgi:Holliday junction resolvase
MGETQVSNYNSGAVLERATVNLLRANGYYAIKSGGSKGIADVIAFKPGETLFVQCKAGNGWISPADRTELYVLACRLTVRPLVAFWAKQGRAARTVGFDQLLGNHEDGAYRAPWTPDWAMEVAG